jgi:hypothetical protein
VLVERLILTVLIHLWVQFQPQLVEGEAVHLLLKQVLPEVAAVVAALRIQTKETELVEQEQAVKVLRAALDYR